jgi:hypothetical protein
MSQLHDKLLSYTHERGIEFDTPFGAGNTLTQTGTNTALPSWSLSGGNPGIVADSPAFGAGLSMQFNSNAGAGSVPFFNTTTISEVGMFSDGLFTLGFWFKLNTLPTANNSGALTLYRNGTAINRVQVSGTAFTSAPSRLHLNFTGSTVAVGPTLEANRWYFLAVRRFANAANSIQVYLDGSLISTLNQATIQSPTQVQFNSNSSATGSTWKIANYFVADPAILDATAISEIWTAGTQTAATNINFTTTPATASNGHFPESAVSTTIGVSFGTEPGTASSLITDPTISGSANNQETFASASSLFVEPTLVVESPNHVEVTTSILVSAEFINPFSVVAVINTSTSAQLMEASADIEQHSVVVAATVSYPAELVGSASALMVEPFRYGPDSVNRIVAPMVASNAIMTGTVSVPTTYFKLVKDLNPLYYVRTWTGGNTTLLNEGSADFGVIEKGPAGSTSWSITQQPSGEPMSGIGDGTSPQYLSGTSNQNTWAYLDEAKFPDILADLYITKNFTHEWWYKPSITTTQANSSTWKYQDGVLGIDLKQSLSLITLIVDINTINTTGGDQTYTFSIAPENYSMLHNTWHHMVVQFEPSSTSDMKVSIYINNILVGSQTKPFLSSRANLFAQLTSGIGSMRWTVTGGTIALVQAPVMWDEVAIYPTAIGTSAIQSHYNFIDTLSPNKTVVASPFEADATFPEPDLLREENKNFPATPITGSALFVDPTVLAQRFLTFTTTPGTASALSVNPSFYGTPDYRKNAEVLTVFAEMSNNNFALDDTYYSYVHTNLTPFRYVTFDGQVAYQDFGSDNDYFVIPTTYAGTVTSPAFGINNRSAKTAGIDFRQDGIILKESEWNDNWGTSTNNWHSSFWMQRSGDDESTGTADRMVWNINGYKDNQYALLYQFNNKLWLQYNKPDPNNPFVEVSTAGNLNLFDYERHHVVVVAQHVNNNNNYLRVYVDGTKVIDHNMGTYVLDLTNYTTSQPANSETYNHPRLAVGGMITSWAYTGTQGPGTGLWDYPQNIKIYVDEIHWAKTTLTDTQVANLYTAMPAKDNNEWYADFFLGQNATLVNPTFGTGCTITATPLTASAQAFVPTVFTTYQVIITATPLTASAIAVEPGFYGDDVRQINFAADFMLASAFFVGPNIIQTVGANAMLARIFMVNSDPYFDPYNALIIQQSRVPLGSNYSGRWTIGDVDS